MREVSKKKVLDATTAKQVFNPANDELCKSIISSFMWCAQSSDGKVRKMGNQS